MQLNDKFLPSLIYKHAAEVIDRVEAEARIMQAALAARRRSFLRRRIIAERRIEAIADRSAR